jgi:NADH-quinone oxidoreductase subunit J
MNLTSILFYTFEALAALSSIALMFARNVFHGALLLITCLLALAGIYIIAFAEFIAVTQILVYAGGILVVIIFGIMLTTKLAGKPLMIEHAFGFSGILAGTLFFGLLVFFIWKESFPYETSTSPAVREIKSIGVGLMTEFMLPFEVAGLLLLVALIGAAIIASTVKAKKT